MGIQIVMCGQTPHEDLGNNWCRHLPPIDHNVIQKALSQLTVDQMNSFCNKLAFTVLPGRQIIASMLLSSVDQKVAALLEVIP